MPHDADSLGNECSKSICGTLAGCINGIGYRCAGICIPVSMVVAEFIQYGFDYSSIGIYILSVVQGRYSTAVSPAKHTYKICHDDRNFFYPVFPLLSLSMQPIILASQSPRRKQLLEWAEIPFEIVVKSTDEHYPFGLLPEEIAIHIARNKAIAVKNKVQPGKTILAADTIVVLGEAIIGKPVHREEAVSILLALSGQKHRVITGVVLMRDEKEISFSDITEVEFHSLSLAQIEFYVDKYKPYDKAGAYAIQEWIGVTGIKSVHGDFYNVIGLPVSRVVQELKRL